MTDGGRVLSAVDNFGRIPVGLMLDAALSDAAKVAYGYLTTWDFRRTGKMFHGREAMADDLSWSTRKLDRALLALEERRYIWRERKGLGQVNDIHLLAEVVSSVESESSYLSTLDSSDGATPITRENARENTLARDAALQEQGLDLELVVARAGVGFADWYRAYPVKRSRLNAERAYTKAVRAGADPARLLAAAKHRASAAAVDPDGVAYCPHPATFLNRGEHDDWADGWPDDFKARMASAGVSTAGRGRFDFDDTTGDDDDG